MGIPKIYGTWFSKRIPQAVIGGTPPLVSSLSFDLNGVFHDARNRVFESANHDSRVYEALADTDQIQLELEIQNTIGSIILNMVQIIKPRETLVLAVDGVAPGAKLNQQKSRRERAARDRSASELFDRNAITPGTEFMMRLDHFMVRFIADYRRYLPPTVIYSSHLVPGEGEHKIMDLYRSGELATGPVAQKGGVHVLYGLDADLIMLSLLSPLNNIYLSRETVKQVVNINAIKEYLMNQSQQQNHQPIDDFVVLMFLIGNDFLPHSPALEDLSESVDFLLQIYAEGNFRLTNDGEINWQEMGRFIKNLASQESRLLATLSVKQPLYPSRFLQAALQGGKFHPGIFRAVWYQNALGSHGPPELKTALETITGLEINPVKAEMIQSMIYTYVKTMNWIYLYYRKGTSAINQDWSYPYYHTPLLSDLAILLASPLPQEVLSGHEANPGMLSFTALHQLVAVLPLKSKDLLPNELKPLFLDTSPIRDFFPDDFIIEMDGKNKEHEGLTIVPLIDRQRIFDAIGSIPFTFERAKLWLPAETQYYLHTEEDKIAILRQQEQLKAKAFKEGRGRGRGDREQKAFGGRGGQREHKPFGERDGGQRSFRERGEQRERKPFAGRGGAQREHKPFRDRDGQRELKPFGGRGGGQRENKEVREEKVKEEQKKEQEEGMPPLVRRRVPEKVENFEDLPPLM